MVLSFIVRKLGLGYSIHIYNCVKTIVEYLWNSFVLRIPTSYPGMNEPKSFIFWEFKIYIFLFLNKFSKIKHEFRRRSFKTTCDSERTLDCTAKENPKRMEVCV